MKSNALNYGCISAGRSSHPDLTTGSALQAAVCQLEVDFYPYHLAAGDRTHWVKYVICCLMLGTV